MSQITEYLQKEEERHLESAKLALRGLIGDAKIALQQIEETGYPRSSVAGAVLNGQRFDDAERALTSLRAIADARAISERVEVQS